MSLILPLPSLELLLRGCRTNPPGGWLQTTPMHHSTSPHVAHLLGRLGWHRSPAKETPVLWDHLCTTACLLQAQPAVIATQSEDRSCPLTCQHQSGLNYNRRARTTRTRDTPGTPSSGEQGDCSPGPHRTPIT